MKLSTILSTMTTLLVLNAAHCEAEQVWDSGTTLFEIIGYDLQAHDLKQQLTDYQTNAVCLLLGYFRGFAESAAITEHYDATALPFILPDGITNEQIEHVVYKFLADNPDKLTQRGDAVLVAALAKRYPNPSFTPLSPKG